MNEEWLTYRLLSDKPSEKLIKDLIGYKPIASDEALCSVLQNINNQAAFQYLCDTKQYVDAIQDALCFVYDESMLQLLFEEVFRNAESHAYRHLATHTFQTKEKLFDLFDGPFSLQVQKSTIADIARTGLAHNHIIAATSMVLPRQHNLYFSFSIAQEIEGKEDEITAQIIKKGYAHGHLEWYDAIEWYMKNKLDKEKSLFDLVGLEASDYL